MPKGEIFIYADNTAIFYFGKIFEALLEKLLLDLNNLNKWLIKKHTILTNYVKKLVI